MRWITVLVDGADVSVLYNPRLSETVLDDSVTKSPAQFNDDMMI